MRHPRHVHTDSVCQQSVSELRFDLLIITDFFPLNGWSNLVVDPILGLPKYTEFQLDLKIEQTTGLLLDLLGLDVLYHI
jgi:hypothetical protein